MNPSLDAQLMLLQSQLAWAGEGVPVESWPGAGAIAAAVVAFGGTVAAIGRFAGPLITRLVESKSAEAIARAKLSDNVVAHQEERDRRNERIEIEVRRLATQMKWMNRMIFSRLGHGEPPPDSDTDLIGGDDSPDVGKSSSSS